MRRLPIRLTGWGLSQIVFLIVIFNPVFAGGISVDAGLTPAENRWIVRYQHRLTEKTGNMDSKMTMKMNMIAIAYGLKPYLTVMMMQGLTDKTSEMNSMTDGMDGRNDMNLLAKYRVYRHNTRDSILGIAATLKLSIPTGTEMFTTDYWSISPGIYLSKRWNTWAIDASSEMNYHDLFNQRGNDLRRGWAVSCSIAGARQIAVNGRSELALAPVIELNGNILQPDFPKSGNMETRETSILLSPGIKVTYRSFILEALWQIPVWDELPENSMNNSEKWLAGFRFMF
ncbi:MAG: hypothetical protein ACE5D7_08420 [Fidelibacterota bacterium]